MTPRNVARGPEIAPIPVAETFDQNVHLQNCVIEPPSLAPRASPKSGHLVNRYEVGSSSCAPGLGVHEHLNRDSGLYPLLGTQSREILPKLVSSGSEAL